MRYIASKEKREFLKDLKEVYGAINLDNAQEAFCRLENKWVEKYPYAIKSWLENWDDLTVFFGFPGEVRTIIYTTNIIENLNRNIRKFTKNKVMFPDDDAMRKAVYLAIQQSAFAWRNTIKNWPLIANQFKILYPDRVKINEVNLYERT